MEKFFSAIFEHISTFFENLRPEIKGFLLIFFGLLYGSSYWLSNHNEFKSIRSIMLYLSITIIVLLFIDLNRFLKEQNEKEKREIEQEALKKEVFHQRELEKGIVENKRKREVFELKQTLKTLNKEQLQELERAISKNDPVIPLFKPSSYQNDFDFNVLSAKGLLKNLGNNLYKIPDNIFKKLKQLDLYEYMEE